jgi:phage/plasmid-associated DNA primase
LEKGQSLTELLRTVRKVTVHFDKNRQLVFDSAHIIATNKALAGNHKPSFRNVDEAIRRRVKLVPFTVTIPEAERDQELSTKLKAEWPGILRWMIDGCLMWQRDGLNPPAVVTKATDSYLTGQDDLQQFIDDACVTGPNDSDSIEHLWDGWTDWAEDHHEFVGTQRRFGDRLEDKGKRANAKQRPGRGWRKIERPEAAATRRISRSKKVRKNNGDGRDGHIPPFHPTGPKW